MKQKLQVLTNDEPEEKASINIDKDSIETDRNNEMRLSGQSRHQRMRKYSGVSASTEKKTFTMRYSDGINANRSILYKRDVLNETFHIREDRKFAENPSEPHSVPILQELHTSFQKPENAESGMEKLKKKCELQKKIIQELDAKLHESLLREEKLRLAKDQALINKYELLKSDNEKLKIENNILQKDVHTLAQKLKNLVTIKSTDRSTKMENILKQREKDLDELIQDKGSLEKIKKEQEKAIAALKQERDQLTRVINELAQENASLKRSHNGVYREDVVPLKVQLREFQKRVIDGEKLIKQQAYIITILDARQKELCDKAGMTLNPLLDQQKREEFLKSMHYYQKNFLRASKNADQVIIDDTWIEALESSEDENAESPNISSAEKYKSVRGKYSGLKKSNKVMERKLKAEIELLVKRLNEVELKLRERDKVKISSSERSN